MSIPAAFAAFFTALAEWFKTAAIRERRELRTEARQLRHEILKAADSGNSRLLGELQDAISDNQRDRETLLAATSSESPKGGGDSNG
jgi:hypothetical protein